MSSLQDLKISALVLTYGTQGIYPIIVYKYIVPTELKAAAYLVRHLQQAKIPDFISLSERQGDTSRIGLTVMKNYPLSA